MALNNFNKNSSTKYFLNKTLIKFPIFSLNQKSAVLFNEII